jgi:hypothetical protein
MKRLLPGFTLLLFSFVLQAQTVKMDAKKFKEDAGYRNALSPFFDRKRSSADTADLTRPKAYLVHPKPGIHRLPQDNMPCIVPDPGASVAIPNVWAGKTKVPFRGNAPRIPNPAKPFKLSPSRPLKVYPNTDTNTK